MNERIIFSIITVSYNSEKYIYDAIKSVLSQTYENFEYIILDDNSTDGSWEIISGFKDPRIKAIKNSSNIGEYSNRNKGVCIAKGEYVIFIDGDDIIYYNALETFFHYIKLFPECAMICARGWDFRILYPFEADPTTVYQFEFIGNSILGGNFTKILFKKEAIEQAGYFPPNITTGDTYLQLRIAMYHPMLLISDGLTWWRKRKGNATDNFFKDQRHLSELINYRIYFLNHPDCPLSAEEKEIAKTNIYGNYIRILFRMIFRFQFNHIAYLCRKIKIPFKFYRAVFIPSQRSFYEKIDGDNPLHSKRTITSYQTIDTDNQITQ